MFGKVKVGNKEIEMVSNGATPYRFRQVFKRDLLKFFADAAGGKVEDGDAADVSQKLGYIMAMQAKKEDMNRLNEDSFITWLENFETNELVIAAEDIIAVYTGNTDQVSKAKKENGPQEES